jgi:hypothetical protein
MNEQQIVKVLAQFGVSNLANALVAGIVVLLAKNPNATDADLLSEDEGSIKHIVRGKIGWLVDLIWPDIQPYLDQSIRTAIATVRGQGQGENI